MPDVQYLPAIIETDDIAAGKKEYRVITRVKNNLLLTAIEKAGYASVVEFAAKMGIEPSKLRAIINFRYSPLDKNGNWRPIVHRMCEALNKMPRQLFTERQMHIRNAEAKTTEVSEAEAVWALEHSGGDNPLQMLEMNERYATLRAALDVLTPREKEIMTQYYGLDGEPQTIKDLAEKFDLCRERLTQIHNKALLKLQRQASICQLKGARFD
jgi:RNA polymerase sigma factor (sigma-70 family)